MGLEDLRRWHWAGIGLVVGLAFGGVRVFYGPNLDTGFAFTLNNERQFERGITANPNTTDKIFDIVVYPRNEDGEVTITFTQFKSKRQRVDPNDPNSNELHDLRPAKFTVTEPYKPQNFLPVNASNDLTVTQYLDAISKQFPDAEISYRYAWWAVPANMLAACAAAGVFLIGGIWPSVIGLLTGAGIWGPRPRQKAGYDLDRFGTGAEPASQTAVELSEAEKLRQQQEMEDALLAKLDGFSEGGGTRRDSIDEEVEIRALAGGKLEGGADPAKTAEQDKSYKGDFYPVARPAGKKDE